MMPHVTVNYKILSFMCYMNVCDTYYVSVTQSSQDHLFLNSRSLEIIMAIDRFSVNYHFFSLRLGRFHRASQIQLNYLNVCILFQ